MWWNDIKEIKDWMVTIASRLTGLDVNVDIIKQTLDESEEFDSSFHRLEEMEEKIDKIREGLPKLEKLVNPDHVAEAYEKHISKLESMMLEFKGCVSMARAAVSERKEQQKEFEDLKELAKISKQIYNSMQSFIDAGNQLEHKNYFKLDAIYRKICEINDEKPKKKGNSRKKPASTPSP